MKQIKLLAILLFAFGLSGQATAAVRAVCKTSLYHIEEGQAPYLMGTWETIGEADTEAEAIQTMKSRSLYTCRQMYVASYQGDPLDCFQDMFDVTCRSAERRASCFSPSDTCEFYTVVDPIF